MLQMKKSDDGHKLADNGKKDGIIHDGIIQESISEVGSQEELFHSKEGFGTSDLILNEPSREKTNNMVSKQVQHKLTCTTTEAG